MSDSTETVTGDCTGAGDCVAPRHLHGCYADYGTCDSPGEHKVVDLMAALEQSVKRAKRARLGSDSRGGELR